MSLSPCCHPTWHYDDSGGCRCRACGQVQDPFQTSGPEQLLAFVAVELRRVVDQGDMPEGVLRSVQDSLVAIEAWQGAHSRRLG